MIKITVELYPFGFEDSKRTIGEMYIANDGTGNQEIGNYYGEIDGKEMPKVKGHIRSEGIWSLIYKFLDKTL